jgi:ribosome-binding protein aMBF1 (putative translation factor)
MLYCDECGKSTRGKRPQFAVEQDLVWICNKCDEAMTWEQRT